MKTCLSGPCLRFTAAFDKGRALLKECMESVASVIGLKVPVLAEPKTGATWAAVK